jgi:hypothetical protein
MQTVILGRPPRAIAVACASVAVALFAADCGSKSSSTSTSSTSGSATSGAASAKKYHAGEFCSSSKEAAYRKLGLTCVNGRLKKT